MRYVALLRGINVGGTRTVPMPRLASAFESAGFTGVTTYLNSGNVLFDGDTGITGADIEPIMLSEFGFPVPTLVKPIEDMRRISAAIPPSWTNDTAQKTDVAYLFSGIDTGDTLDYLPFQREYVDVRYVPGALIWNVSRENYGKSRLNKIVGHRLYPFMTVRNVNTARFLGSR